jgi:hypothetical protein
MGLSWYPFTCKKTARVLLYPKTNIYQKIVEAVDYE